jgi:UDP-3-O-[3-hydroxymyristoyl] glucosamine N-acyltransferase
MRLGELAGRLQCPLEGRPDSAELEIVRAAGIEQAQAGDLTFIAHARYLSYLTTTHASAVIVAPGVEGVKGGPALLRSPNPYLSFAQALAFFAGVTRPSPGVDRLSSIAADAVLGADVSIGPFVTVGAGADIGARTIIYPNTVVGAGAHVGADCVLHANVSVRERVVIGDRVIVQDGAVIGSDGFGFVTQPDRTHVKIPQHGDVVIEDDVEIGANTAIDRPAVGETRIGAGTKIDNLVQIGHGVTVGHRVRFAAQVGIAGSTVVEDDVVLAGQVGVAGHVRIGRGVVASAQTGIPNSVEAGAFVSGYPAISNRDWLKASAVYRRLPELKRRVVELEQRIAELEERFATRPPGSKP